MEVNKELLAPCGLYCGVCGVIIATRNDDHKFRQRLSTVYGVRPDQVRCRGCMSDDLFVYCQVCPIRDCVNEKGYQGCHQCDDFPCGHIEKFPLPVGKKVQLRAIPQWRKMGTEKWVEAEEKRYVCPNCGYKLFRGAKRCRSCREPVDLD